MSRVVQVLQQQLAAATAAPPASPAEAAFKEQMLPQIAHALEQLQQPPAQLLAGVEEEVRLFETSLVPRSTELLSGLLWTSSASKLCPSVDARRAVREASCCILAAAKPLIRPNTNLEVERMYR